MSLGKMFLNIVFITVSCLSQISVGAEYDVTFYNVGQGNCIIMKNPKKQLLIVDAGSSSTIGVLPLKSRGKTEELASEIVEFIKNDVKKAKWLYFVVTHSDKDHLNLIVPIISQLFPDLQRNGAIEEDYAVGILFGGNKDGYTDKKEGKTLVEFLEEYKINHFFGRSSFQKEKAPKLFFVPKKKNEFFDSLYGWGPIQFLSVCSTAEYKRNEISAEESSNAESIVMRVECNGTSFMLTGDKTQKEIKLLIKRFEEEGKSSESLETDILLATHHGSSEDFSPEWIKAVNPKAVVFSSGRSSFGHPRREAVYGSLSNRLLALDEYHFIQFDGSLITEDYTSTFFRSVFRETPNSERKAAGYVYGLTNAAIFGTANQGNICVKISKSVKFEYGGKTFHGAPHEIIQGFLSSPSLLNGEKIYIECVYLDKHKFDVSKLIPSIILHGKPLKKVQISNCDVGDDHTTALVEMIETLVNLSELDLTGNKFTPKIVEQLKEVWGYRGFSI